MSETPYRQGRQIRQGNPAMQGRSQRRSSAGGQPMPRREGAYPINNGNYRRRTAPQEELNEYERQELERIRRGKARAKRRKKQQQRMLVLSGMLGCFFILLLCLIGQVTKKETEKETPVFKEETIVMAQPAGYVGELVQGLPSSVFYTHPYWEEDFLSISDWARPGEELPEVKSVFVHYTANRNTSAAQNRSYFEGLKDSHETAASAHFIIGYDGEIIQCIPLDEIGYAVKTRNYDSVSIECCYKSQDGSFSPKTYDSLITLLKWLTEAYDLTEEDILRHYDCGGKLCPIYYAENPDEWEKLKEDVAGR